MNRLKIFYPLKIFLLALFAAAVFFLCCGFTISGEASIDHNGRGSAEFTVETDASEETFRDELQKKIEIYNAASGGDDVFSLKKVKRTENGYLVGIKFIRIEHFGGFGSATWGNFSELVRSGSAARLKIENWESGNLRTSVPVVYKDSLDMLEVERGAKKNQTYVIPKNREGQELSVETLFEAGEKEYSGDRAITFMLFNLEHITSLKIRLSGKIHFYGGDGVEVIDDNTLSITPHLMKVNISHYDAGVDAEAQFLPDVEVNSAVGYVVYEKTMSPIARIGIALLCVMLFTGIVLAIFYFYRLGKREQRVIGKMAPPLREIKAESSGNSVVAVAVGERDFGKEDGENTANPANAKRANPVFVGVKKFVHGRSMTLIKRHWGLYVLLLPLLLCVVVFCYAPMFGLSMSFMDYDISRSFFDAEFVGLKHYKKIFSAEMIGTYRVFRNTIYISLIRIGTNFPIILIFTLLVNEIKNQRAKFVVRTISYIPHFISWIAVGGMAYNLLSVDGGIFNQILSKLGMEPVLWYAEEDYWWGILAVSSLWKGMGWATLIYMSALSSINDELYDACAIDGGGRFRQALSVTLPGLMNVIMLQLILDIGSIMGDNFEQILAMINGSQSLSKTTKVVGMLQYEALTGAAGSSFSRAAAYGMIQSVIGFVLVLFANRLAKKTGSEGII